MSDWYFDIGDEGKRLFITQTAMRAKLPAIVVENNTYPEPRQLYIKYKSLFADGQQSLNEEYP